MSSNVLGRDAGDSSNSVNLTRLSRETNLSELELLYY